MISSRYDGSSSTSTLCFSSSRAAGGSAATALTVARETANRVIEDFKAGKESRSDVVSRAGHAGSSADIVRRLVDAADRANANPCYVLAAMLERKRVLKQIQTEHGDHGRVLIYEHAKTGDVFLVPDPQLRLDELGDVQTEVAQLLQSSGAMG